MTTRTLPFTGRLARASARRPWLTLTIWLLATVGFIAAAGSLQLTDDGGGGTFESDVAEGLWEEHAGDSRVPTEVIVVSSDSLTFADAVFAERVAALAAAAAGVEGVADVTAPTPADVAAGAPVPVSADGDTVLITVTLEGTDTDAHQLVAEELQAAVDAVGSDAGADAEGVRAGLVGYASGANMFDRLVEDTLMRGELIGIGVAFVILAIVFGALVAATMPILMAIVSIIAAVGAAGLVSGFMDLHDVTMNMIVMMGLALGIDYALFAVQRFREERAAGREVADAVQIMGATANRAILISGSTVVVSLVSMLLVPSMIMRSLGLGAILVAVASVVAALTLLPAVLRLLGDRVNAVPLRRKAARGAGTGGLWARIAKGAVARPVASAVGAVVVLLALAIPALSLRQGFSGVESLPADNELRVSAERIADEFGYGSETTYVVLTGDAVVAADAVAANIAADPAYADVEVDAGDPAVFPDGAAFVVARDVYEISEPEALAALERVRETHVPDALASVDAGIGAVGSVDAGTVLVGGSAAESADFSGVMSAWFPWVVGGVLLASFLILMVVFRSLAVPAMTLFVNALSVLAAFGVLVGAFQFGWGEAIGFTQVDAIAPWLPLFLFAVLFGLSMDYHVFLLSRVREFFGLHGDARQAVVSGVRVTGALITGAALIMVAVFGGFASGDVSEFSQMGLGLAVAIILDATLVRVVLVPALLALMGARAWSVPSWLAWLPAPAGEGVVGEPTLPLREAAHAEAAAELREAAAAEAARV